MNGQRKHPGRREWGEHTDLRLTKDKDAGAHKKKGVVQLFAPAMADEPSLGVRSVFLLLRSCWGAVLCSVAYKCISKL